MAEPQIVLRTFSMFFLGFYFIMNKPLCLLGRCCIHVNLVMWEVVVGGRIYYLVNRV